MASRLQIDFETRSAADLKKVGLHNYAIDPTTDVWCMAYAFDDEPVQLWTGGELPCAIGDHLMAAGLVYAHNAAFEIAIWNEIMVRRYEWPALILSQMRCTMSMALAMGLPASLEHCAAALGVEQQKDMKGSRVMMQLARPRKIVEAKTCVFCGGTGWDEDGECGGCHGKGGTDEEIVWWDDPAKLQTLYDYCRQDVEVERACHKRMRELSPDEQKLWVMYQRMNQRGIPLDLEAIDKAIALVDSEKARLDALMREVTGNVVAGCTDVRQLTNWLRYRGVSIAGVAKADLSEALARTAQVKCSNCDGAGFHWNLAPNDSGWADKKETCLECHGHGSYAVPELPADCRRALELRQEAAKSSTAKLTAMRDGASPDGRVRGCVQHHGAHTGRSAGRRVQPLNMPRPAILHEQEHVEDVIAHLEHRQYLDVMYGPPMTLLSDCLRGMLAAEPGREFVCCDYSNIEGRVLAWLAGESWKLQAFRDFDAGTGPDLYLLAYAKAFHCTIEEARAFRQIGKVMELALGYEGGVGAFQTMARGYGVKVSDARADELKHAWRAAHPATKQLWKGLNQAAIRAVKEGGVHAYRAIKYVVKGSFLFCQLPSGRVLTYPYPRLEDGVYGASLSYMCVNSVSHKWERHHTYGGDLTNHVTQATARDILTHGLQNLEAHFEQTGIDGWLDLEVYDEALAEVPIGTLSVDKMSTLMSNAPHWADGLPIAATGWAGRRYRKD